MSFPKGDRLLRSLGIPGFFWCLCVFFKTSRWVRNMSPAKCIPIPERFFAWAFYSKYVSELDEDEERELEGMIKERLACP